MVGGGAASTSYRALRAGISLREMWTTAVLALGHSRPVRAQVTSPRIASYWCGFVQTHLLFTLPLQNFTLLSTCTKAQPLSEETAALSSSPPTPPASFSDVNPSHPAEPQPTVIVMNGKCEINLCHCTAGKYPMEPMGSVPGVVRMKCLNTECQHSFVGHEGGLDWVLHHGATTPTVGEGQLALQSIFH